MIYYSLFDNPRNPTKVLENSCEKMYSFIFILFSVLTAMVSDYKT